MNILTKQQPVFSRLVSNLMVLSFLGSGMLANAQTPSQRGCIQIISTTTDNSGLSFYHSEFFHSEINSEPQSNRLRLETLTGGQWVGLDLSQQMIESINQPLRISYVSTDHPNQKLKVELQLVKFLVSATIGNDENTASQTATLKPPQYKFTLLGYKGNNLNSVVIPRLNPGVYSLQLKFNNKKSAVTHWLKVTPTPPEPPLLHTINQRLSEQGKLTLKLENVVVGDKVRFYINGEEGPGVNLTKESQLQQYFPLGEILPPGSSNITARIERDGKQSRDSTPVTANSRATTILARNIDVQAEIFERDLKNKLNDERSKSETVFQFITEPELTGLTQDQPVRNTEVAVNYTDLKASLKYFEFINSGWDHLPVINYPDPETVAASHEKITSSTLMKEPGIKSFTETERDKLIDGFNESQEFTLDATFKAMDPSQANRQLTRIVSLSKNTGNRYFTLGQFEGDLVFRFTARPLLSKSLDPNGMGVKIAGTNQNRIEGIHFKTGLNKDQICKVVISYQNQKLRFWFDGKEIRIPEATYALETIKWTKDCHLIIGDEAGQPVDQTDRKWKGKIHSISIRTEGVFTRKPDSDCMKFLKELKESTASLQNHQADSRLAYVSAVFQTPPSRNNASENSGEYESLQQSLDSASTVSSQKKLSIREFAFPYPASFPVPCYGLTGKRIDTEGVVLDQMRLMIFNDGRYHLDFEARTTMKAVINLQLLVQLENGQWYPLTLPRQTILPNIEQRGLSDSLTPEEFRLVSIKGYAPVLVGRRGEIQNIRRRGNALFGTRPY